MTLPAEGTLLILDSMGVPLYSARGLTQTLEPVEQQRQLVRTINGELVDISDEQFRLYKSTISCTDRNAPALSGVWRGLLVTVDCVFELAYLTSGGIPERAVVTGSSRVEGSFTFYRPQLDMMVVNFTLGRPEYEADHAWTLELEEVAPPDLMT